MPSCWVAVVGRVVWIWGQSYCCKLAMMFLWVSSTPLGRPVVPLEYGRNARSEDSQPPKGTFVPDQLHKTVQSIAPSGLASFAWKWPKITTNFLTTNFLTKCLTVTISIFFKSPCSFFLAASKTGYIALRVTKAFAPERTICLEISSEV